MNLLPPSFSFSGDRNKAITLRPFAIHAYNRVVREAARGGVPFANYFKTLPDGSIVHFKARALWLCQFLISERSISSSASANRPCIRDI